MEKNSSRAQLRQDPDPLVTWREAVGAALFVLVPLLLWLAFLAGRSVGTP